MSEPRPALDNVFLVGTPVPGPTPDRLRVPVIRLAVLLPEDPVGVLRDLETPCGDLGGSPAARSSSGPGTAG